MAFRDAFNRRSPGFAGGTLEEQLARDALLQSQEPQVLTPQNQQAITRPRTVNPAPIPEQAIAPAPTTPSFKDRFARPQQEGFGSSGEPFGSVRPRRTQPRDVIADDAQYLRDLQTQPRGKREKIMDVIDAVNAGFGNKPRTTLTKRERQMAEAEGRLGTELTVGQKQNVIQQGQMIPVTLEDGSTVQVPARSAGTLQSQQQRIRQQAEQALERKRVNSARIDRWERMDSRDRKRLLADLYKSGGTNDPEQLEYIADQLGIPGTLRPKFIQGQMRDAVDAEGNLIQVNRQTQEVLPTGAKSYETTKEAGRNRRFTEGQAGATSRAGMRGTGRGAAPDRATARKAAEIVGKIETARKAMEQADIALGANPNDATAKETRARAQQAGEGWAAQLNALDAGYEAGPGKGGFPYYKKREGAPQGQQGQAGGRTIDGAVKAFTKRLGRAPTADEIARMKAALGQ